MAYSRSLASGDPDQLLAGYRQSSQTMTGVGRTTASSFTLRRRRTRPSHHQPRPSGKGSGAARSAGRASFGNTASTSGFAGAFRGRRLHRLRLRPGGWGIMFPMPAPANAPSSVHGRFGSGQGAGCRGRLEHPRPGAWRRLHRDSGGAAETDSSRSRERSRRSCAQVRSRARLPASQDALGVFRRPHRGALRVRKPRPRRAWWRSHGNEMWQFAADGLMSHRYASINDEPIEEAERRVPPR